MPTSVVNMLQFWLASPTTITDRQPNSSLNWLHASHLTHLRDVAVTKHSFMFRILGTADVMGKGRPGRFFLHSSCMSDVES